jgi:2-dehydropantoate 2-reductase
MPPGLDPYDAGWRTFPTIEMAKTAKMAASPRICVYGAGAIGGTIGTRLSMSGATVSVVAHGQTLLALQRDGLRLISAGKTLRAQVKISADPMDLGAQDYVIVAVKAPALPEIATRIAPLIGPETAVVTAMNGLPWWFFVNDNGPLAGQHLPAIDPFGTIHRSIPATRVIGCVIYMACSVDQPGIIRHHTGRRLLIGEVYKSSRARIPPLVGLLRRAGFDCEESADIRRDIWLKLWANLSTNPISFLTAATLDRIIDEPLVHALCVRMMKEAAQIGSAIGIPLAISAEDIIDKARMLGPFKTSMLQDAERGNPPEIDALLTVMHDIGQTVGVPTPYIDSVLGLARLRANTLGLLNDAA